jgi:serine/threonine-protein kinase
MLYELLTGRLPFRGDNPVQLMYRHVSEQPQRPRELNPAIPLELEAVVLRALAKLPVDRFPDARAMREAIARRPGAAPVPAQSTSIVRPAAERFQPEPEPRIRRGADPTARTIVGRPERQRGRRWPLAMFAGALLLAGSGVVLALRELDGDDTPSLGALATATEAGQPAVNVDPTATPTGEEAVLAATEPEATPTDLPPATETPTPGDDDDDDDVSPAPIVAFNEPFLVTSIPPEWQQGSSASFGRDEFVDGGAYRREDGMLYDKPAAHLYAQDTDYPATTVDFIVDGRPDADSHVGIVITGMDDELPGKVPCRITLNGNVVWEGESPFENETWTAVGWHVGSLDWLKPGRNRLTIEVLVEDGEFGLPPWILLTEAAVYWD